MQISEVRLYSLKLGLRWAVSEEQYKCHPITSELDLTSSVAGLDAPRVAVSLLQSDMPKSKMC